MALTDVMRSSHTDCRKQVSHADYCYSWVDILFLILGRLANVPPDVVDEGLGGGQSSLSYGRSTHCLSAACSSVFAMNLRTGHGTGVTTVEDHLSQ